ncbi:PAS domain S-box protein [Arenibaculum sp.]|uniref:sensor histidine kinase n=1 Tax=Arenibaculum sp. TaxID=2865862 RepID=UPI002E152913|nr:PAS domain S-box protein [Arenibaculum sp.]
MKRLPREVLDSVLTFIAVLMPDGRVVHANRNCFEVSGVSPAEVLGRHFAETPWFSYSAEASARVRDAVERARRGESSRFEIDAMLSGGRLLPLEFALAPMASAGRRAARLVASAIDVSDRRRAQSEASQREERLAFALASSEAGAFDVDLDTGRTILSDGNYRLYGFAPGAEPPGPDEWVRRLVHPDDRDRVSRSMAQFVERRANQFRLEFRILYPAGAPSGSVKWLLAQGRIDYRADGRPARISGINADVTERKRVEEALRDSLREKEMLLREVHHRVKNNIQAIWGMVQIEAQRLKHVAPARERFEAIAHRLEALGRLHQHLYRSEDISMVDLAAYLDELARDAIDMHGGSAEIALETELASTHCDIDTALPVGLIASELIHNALRHAFPDGRGGRVRIELRGSRDRFELVVADDGVGHAGPDRPDGIGMLLVRALAAQIEARWDVEHDGGTRHRLSVGNGGG